MDAPTVTSPTTPEPAGRGALRPSRLSRLSAGIVAGGAAFAVVLAGLGIASAQTQGSTTTAPPVATPERDQRPPHRHHRVGLGASLATVASTLGIDLEALGTQLRSGRSIAEIAGDRTDAVVDALVAEKTERLDAAVAAGRLTRAQADERKAGLHERVTTMVHRTVVPADAGIGKPIRRGLSVAASTLGITEEALRTELQSGKSLASIAGDRTPAVIDALVADANARIDQAVADGRLTAEQAAERKAKVTEQVTAHVHAIRTPGHGGRGHRHGARPAPADGGAEAAPASIDA